MALKDLSIIIVSYNTKKILIDCLNSIIKNTKSLNYEIIVVDNASIDGTKEIIRNEFQNIKLIANNKNLGFAKATNQGIMAALGENILLLNSDTLILDNCLYRIFKFIKTDPNIGLLGCKVLNSDCSLQYSCFYKPNILTELILFTKGMVKNIWDPLTYWQYLRYWGHKEIKEVEVLSGCFLWLKVEVIDEVGLLDENMFMYYEDAEFCVRVKKKSNYKILYYPREKIVHLHGASSKHTEIKLETIKHCYKSAKYYLNKCYGATTELLFDRLCKAVWTVEIYTFSFLKFNKKFNKKINLLRRLKEI